MKIATMSNSKIACTVVLFLLAAVTSTQARKKDRNRPHGHMGKLTPYSPGPFHIKLSNAEESKLRDGKPVMKQNMEGESGGAICVQDVNAPIDAVWYQILDMDNYKSKVSKVNECRNYFVKKQHDGHVVIKTKQVLGVLPGYSYESYYDHTYYPKESSMTWSLDYDKTSDFDDVAGHWHVTPHPQKPESCTRVFYACDIKMKGSVPKPILNYISKAALKQATGWVKKESEAHPAKTIPAEYGGSKKKVHAQETTPEPELVGAGVSATRRRFWNFRKPKPAEEEAPVKLEPGLVGVGGGSTTSSGGGSGGFWGMFKR